MREGVRRQQCRPDDADVQYGFFAANLGDLRLELALTFAPAHDIARPNVDAIRAHIGAGEIDREPLSTQGINGEPGVAPTIATSLDIYGPVGVLHQRVPQKITWTIQSI